MIERIVGFSIDRRGLVIGVWFALALVGAWAASHLQLDALPDLTNNQVQILTRAPGLTPEEVELRVTRPIETALGGLPGLATHRSSSRYGLSAITAVFEDEVSTYRARQLTSERLALVTLPEGVEAPEMGPMTGGLGEIFHFTLTSPQRTTAELLELAQLRVVPTLRGAPGIVEVNTWGGARRTLEVRTDPVKLAQRGLSLDAVREAVQRATGAVPGASIPSGDGQVLLRAVARPRAGPELGAAVVARTADGIVRRGDGAARSAGARPRIGAATANGRGETVYVMAQMLLGANAREVTAGVRARMPALAKLLPPDVEIHMVYDRRVLVDGTLRTVGKNLLEGGLLVIGVLLLMLGSWRAGTLVALAIPLSMLGALAAMVALGIPGNLMSLGAIDFGLLVDGAVVLVENIFHTLAPNGQGASPDAGLPMRARIRAACQAVARPVFASVMVILLVYVPVLAMTGVDGKLFRPMAITVVLALVTALLLTLTLIPAAASLVLREKDVPARPPRLVRLIDRGYGWVLRHLPRLRIAVTAVAIVLLVIAGILFRRAGSELAPQLDEGDLVVQTTRRPDLSIEAAIAAATALEKALLRVPEVRQVVSRIGSPAVATDVMGIEQADVFIALAPRARWRPGLTRDALIAELEARTLAASPGSEPAFTQPIQMRFNELLGGASSDVVVSVYGDNLSTLREAAEAIAAAVGKVPGVVDARALAPADVPLLEVRPRPLDVASAGLDVSDVLETVQAVRFGLDAGIIYDGPLSIPVVLTVGGVASEWDLEQLGVPSPTGGTLALSSVADVARIPTPGVVQHDLGVRRLSVGFNVRGADLGGAVEAAQRAVARTVELPHGYLVKWGGQYESLEAAKARLRIVIPLVLGLIVLVLVITFRHLRHALVILTHVPFACVGGIVALSIRGMPLSISAAIGFIALSGIAVMNGVVLLSQVRVLEDTGTPPGEAILTAARARPVLMTALVAALGFVPMMLARGVGAEVQRPLATVVVGGLLTSTILTLIVLPSVYPWLARRRREPAA
ncbi:MAG: CusA/CzcA family heavy metal efflux RND transporter [Kofleriaceae bacterium]|nr:CusA/CzcA family heavy metal efflux RND transporter [Kofleriaceae bacterium]